MALFIVHIIYLALIVGGFLREFGRDLRPIVILLRLVNEGFE